MSKIFARRLAILFFAASLLWAVVPEHARAYSGTATPAVAVKDPIQADNPVEIKKVEMPSDKNIIENISQSPDFSTLVSAIKAAGLDSTLSGAGPFIVFAPTNAAFDKLPKGTLEDLMKPENKDKLTKILKYHVVPGKITSHDISQLGQTGNKIPLRTVQGALINVICNSHDMYIIEDETGSKVKISQTDVKQSNGMIFVVDGVLMPK